jgi:hypothetical protein
MSPFGARHLEGFVTGHDFSHADPGRKTNWALAPERCHLAHFYHLVSNDRSMSDCGCLSILPSNSQFAVILSAAKDLRLFFVPSA